MYVCKMYVCFRECAKDGDISINAFVFLLISGVESVPFKGFIQFSDGEFVELLYYLRQVIFIALSNWKPLEIFNALTPIQ